MGLPLFLLALAGLAIAGYLLAVRLGGGAAVCGPSGGCETVAASSYSTVLGIPVAAYGVGCSLVLTAFAATWWRTADRRLLLAAYGILLLATLSVAVLTFLELFVIRAICPWCVSYAVTIVLSLGTAGLAFRRS